MAALLLAITLLGNERHIHHTFYRCVVISLDWAYNLITDRIYFNLYCYRYSNKGARLLLQRYMRDRECYIPSVTLGQGSDVTV